MKVTILGSGTCTSQLPNIENRYPPAFLVEVGEKKVMFDCSEAVRFRLEKMGYDFEDIHHVALSHTHPDHCAIFHYIQAVFVKGLWGGEDCKNEYLNIYCPQQVVDEFDNMWNFHFPEVANERWEWPKINLHPMTDGNEQVQKIEDGMVLKGRSVYHGFGKVDAIAYRLEAEGKVFAYSGDTGKCEGIKEVVKDADFFICECSSRVGDFEGSTGYGHLNPYEAGELAKQGGVKEMVLVHYTGFDTDDEIMKECRRSGYEGKLMVGKDFQQFEV